MISYCSLRDQQHASRCTEIMLCMISRGISRVFCDLRSQKTPRGILSVNSNDNLYWQTQDKKTLKRINELIKSIEREGLAEGIGKPEPLRNRKAWSRRIDDMNRLVYNIDENGFLWIIACRGHYED